MPVLAGKMPCDLATPGGRALSRRNFDLRPGSASSLAWSLVAEAGIPMRVLLAKAFHDRRFRRSRL